MAKRPNVSAAPPTTPAAGINEVQDWPLSKLRPYEANPREHSEPALAQFAAAVKKFGFRYPILARSDGTVVDGHFRLKVAERLGLETVPVLLVDDMTESQVRAFRLSVNRMAELAAWEQDGLLRELEALELEGEPLGEDGPIGFELESFDPDVPIEGWDLSTTRDRFVVTLTGSLPLEAEVRARLKGLEGITIEASVIKED